MQFNSFIFILLFMPVTIILYYLLNKVNILFGKLVIILFSILFYTYCDWTTFIVLGISLVLNYTFSKIIERTKKQYKFFLMIPIIINIGFLLYFKYLNFAITNINFFLNKEINTKKLIMPVGISFFTFQQIAYVVSIYRKEIEKINIIDYLAYILYFPKILIGPLVEPIDFIKQLNDELLKKINWDNIAYGIKIFSLGLFKKVMIADIFSTAVSWGYINIETATSMDWILIMLFYTLEIYFDFSGYSDMAVGISIMLNITLPINFDSPYQAISIRDFWKRWHISLTKFFTKYVYIPMGGNRKGKIFTYINTMLIFLISGFWHGSNWTFILWGGIHGLLMIIDKAFEEPLKRLFVPLRWLMTFTIINILWLLFRSNSITQWYNILKVVFSFNNTAISDGLINIFTIQETLFLTNVLHLKKWTANIRGFWMLLYSLGSLGICFILKNNYKNLQKITMVSMVFSVVTFVWGFICLNGESVFVYFNF